MNYNIKHKIPATNKTKIKYYNVLPKHKQVIINGIRNNGSKYELMCDERISDLIRDINNVNCRTLWSCQGDDQTPAYIVISGGYLTKKNLKTINTIIKKYWHKKYYFIQTVVTSHGDICWYAYTAKLFKRYFKNFECLFIKN